ncbi:MAG: septal ring lytic transglycosylase RlpA family protein [Betaproteobacteria bacterium]
MRKKFQPVSLVILFFLSACGGQAYRPSDSSTPSVEPIASTTGKWRKSSPTQKRGGGYYKDDGPGEDIPDNLDDIPDAIPRFEPLHRFANRPYNVLGKNYVPDTRLKPFRQRGVASWYGKKFHGQKTSIGEPYDMFSMTAAHPTLPIPSYVRITHVASGKTVVVRVIDRGPFHADRIIDLSYAAAHRLGYINNGSSLVEVEAVLPDESTALTYAQVTPSAIAAKPIAAPPERDDIESLAAKLAAANPPLQLASSSAREVPAPTRLPAPVSTGIFLQLGAFSNADNADNLRVHLSRELDWLNEGIQVNASGGMHRVHLGPYKTRSEAEVVAERIRASLGYKPTFVNR